MVPLFLLGMIVTAAMVREPFYQGMFWAQIVFYLLAGIGSLNPASMRFKPVAVSNTFVMLNAAAAVAFYNFVAGRNKVWV